MLPGVTCKTPLTLVAGSDMRALIQEACQGAVRDVVAGQAARLASLSEEDLRPVNLRDFQVRPQTLPHPRPSWFRRVQLPGLPKEGLRPVSLCACQARLSALPATGLAGAVQAGLSEADPRSVTLADFQVRMQLLPDSGKDVLLLDLQRLLVRPRCGARGHGHILHSAVGMLLQFNFHQIMSSLQRTATGMA